MPLYLPRPISQALWEHAARESPRECVGALGGQGDRQEIYVRALYPLRNIAAQPERHYLADPGHLVKVLKVMQDQELRLVGFYHSHPRGPSRPSHTDTALAAYPLPYVIADVQQRSLSAYWLPRGEQVAVVVV